MRKNENLVEIGKAICLLAGLGLVAKYTLSLVLAGLSMVEWSTTRVLVVALLAGLVAVAWHTSKLQDLLVVAGLVLVGWGTLKLVLAGLALLGMGWSTTIVVVVVGVAWGTSIHLAQMKKKKQEEEMKKKKQEEEEEMKDIFKAVGMAAGLGLAAWGASTLLSSSSSSSSTSDENDKKKMKPPGRPGETVIYRDDFENNPGDYFRRLRSENKFTNFG